MAMIRKSLMPRFGVLCRTAAVALIAGVTRKRSMSDVNADIAGRPVPEQTMITGATLGVLLCMSIAAAQFGWIGMLLFWLAVIVVVN
jgi:hypothetical protein